MFCLFLAVNKDFFPILLRPVRLRNGGADLLPWERSRKSLSSGVERYKPFVRRCCLHLQDKTGSESISLLYYTSRVPYTLKMEAG